MLLILSQHLTEGSIHDLISLVIIYFMIGFTCVWFSNGPEIEVLSENRGIRIFQRLGLLFLWPLLILFGLCKMMTR
jgi:hypothetical protein